MLTVPPELAVISFEVVLICEADKRVFLFTRLSVTEAELFELEPEPRLFKLPGTASVADLSEPRGWTGRSLQPLIKSKAARQLAIIDRFPVIIRRMICSYRRVFRALSKRIIWLKLYIA
jgi:hypothetical protein